MYPVVHIHLGMRFFLARTLTKNVMKQLHFTLESLSFLPIDNSGISEVNNDWFTCITD
jgi:hypothetical protein